jgi:hypothetical protein
MHFAVGGVGLAADAVAADRLYPPAEGARLMAHAGAVPHLQMAPERRDHLCLELH